MWIRSAWIPNLDKCLWYLPCSSISILISLNLPNEMQSNFAFLTSYDFKSGWYFLGWIGDAKYSSTMIWLEFHLQPPHFISSLCSLRRLNYNEIVHSDFWISSLDEGALSNILLHDESCRLIDGSDAENTTDTMCHTFNFDPSLLGSSSWKIADF